MVHSNHLGQQRFFCFFFYPKKEKEINFGSLPIKITVEPFFYQLFILSRKEYSRIAKCHLFLYQLPNFFLFTLNLFPIPFLYLFEA
jgi:hypothetical protein